MFKINTLVRIKLPDTLAKPKDFTHVREVFGFILHTCCRTQNAKE